MKLVVGLGNPGRKYAGTRHNLGYRVLDVLAKRHRVERKRLRFDGELAEVNLGREPAVLVAPQTFMNLSGRCVRQVVQFFQVPLGSLLVVCDDLNLPLGRIRIRAKGSPGGNRGLASIIEQLGNDEFPRLRIGIDRPETVDAADFVLDRFTRDEQPVVDEAVDRAADAVEVWANEGIVACMNRFN
jgi:PTH1 family peptidyl-tRNA hydrolase